MEWMIRIVLCVASCVAQQDYTIKTVDLPVTVRETKLRIVGGTPTTIEKYPYTVQVLFSSKHVCGGSLISKRHVLSAAHCFLYKGRRINPMVVTIRAGATNLGRGGNVYKVSAIITHEKFNRTQENDNDVAVMVVSSTVKLGTSVAVAKIPSQGEKVPDNASVVHVGWGYMHPFIPVHSQTLLEVWIRTVPQKVCKKRYQTQYGGSLITDNMICASLLDEGGADACLGDSGGPLVYSGVVVGVTSWGPDCGSKYLPGVSARVARYPTWIYNTVARNEASTPLGNVSGILLAVSILFI